MFTTDLVVKPIDKARWELMSPLAYKSPLKLFIVPEGFITDFASVPRVFWTLLPPATGRHREAAVLHDYLYTIKSTSRKFADNIFLDAMIGAKVPAWKRQLIYWAVRFGGGSYWKGA